MIEVVSIKFKNRGKSYFFDPGELHIKSGDKVIVETSKGLEIADCCYGNHAVEDTAVVQPLRPVIRLATPEDLAVDEANKKRGEDVMISTADSKVKVFVIPTNEELVIARDTRDIACGK